MRLTVEVAPGVIELNWMWLPTWIGLNHSIKKEIEEKVGQAFIQRELTEDTLEELDEVIISFLQDKFPNVRFEKYLRALKDVHQEG